MLRISKDLQEFVEKFLSHKVEFLLVGGHALACHGVARFTEDIDLLVGTAPDNARRIEAAINEFGFEGLGITRADFLEPEQVIQFGRPPNRVDLLTSITGVTWAEAWASKVPVQFGGLNIWMLSRELLLQNKTATGRPQDLADVARLRRTP